MYNAWLTSKEIHCWEPSEMKIKEYVNSEMKFIILRIRDYEVILFGQFFFFNLCFQKNCDGMFDIVKKMLM